MDGPKKLGRINAASAVHSANGLSGRVIAGCFALAAFAVAILAGLASENPASSVLGRAVMAMVVCYPVGMVIGMVCDRIILAQVEAQQHANPLLEPVPVEGGPPAKDALEQQPLVV